MRWADSRQGYTLLEILLVLVIVAVIGAVVIPNVVPSDGSKLRREAKMLAARLALAEEEAQLVGEIVRWSAFAKKYEFSRPVEGQEWTLMKDKPFQAHWFPNGVIILRVQRHDAFLPEGKRDGFLGDVLFFPDGMLTPADVVLSDGRKRIVLKIQPGSGGIRLLP